MKKYKRFLITGGAGFVGSYIGRSIKSHYPDKDVIAIDNLKRRGSELNLPILKNNGVKFIHGDIRFIEDLEPAGKVDCIIDCSAEPSVLSGVYDSPSYLINTNLLGTINCLEFAKKNGSDLIFLSTSRVYPINLINSVNFSEDKTRFELLDHQTIKGVSGKGISEQFSLQGPRSLYGATKLCSEIMIAEYNNCYGIKTVINRCGVITGPGQMGKVDQGFIVLWVANHIFKKEMKYLGFNGSGKQTRDILHIADLFTAIDIELNNIDKFNGNTFNIGGGIERTISLQELTDICRKLTGNHTTIIKEINERPGDIRIYISDNSKFENISGWSPKYDIEKIIDDIIRWIEENKESLINIFFQDHISIKSQHS